MLEISKKIAWTEENIKVVPIDDNEQTLEYLHDLGLESKDKDKMRGSGGGFISRLLRDKLRWAHSAEFAKNTNDVYSTLPTLPLYLQELVLRLIQILALYELIPMDPMEIETAKRLENVKTYSEFWILQAIATIVIMNESKQIVIGIITPFFNLLLSIKSGKYDKSLWWLVMTPFDALLCIAGTLTTMIVMAKANNDVELLNNCLSILLVFEIDDAYYSLMALSVKEDKKIKKVKSMVFDVFQAFSNVIAPFFLVFFFWGINLLREYFIKESINLQLKEETGGEQ